MKKILTSEDDMKQWGNQLGRLLKGGEFLELIGDVGAGKTTFTKGLAAGMGIADNVQSPTFTISRIYQSPKELVLAHYDFYRLDNAGIMSEELREAVSEPQTVIVVEWGDVVADVRPADYLQLQFVSPSETAREVLISAYGEKAERILKELAE